MQCQKEGVDWVPRCRKNGLYTYTSLVTCYDSLQVLPISRPTPDGSAARGRPRGACASVRTQL
jgi:hypothetical protein